MEHTINATGKQLGRVASEVASILRGKNTPSFKPNVVPSVKVHVTNASLLNISPEKMKTKEYKRFSGYPGGLNISTMEKVVEKKGYGEVFKKAVNGMLPKNKLRSLYMKNLTVSE